MADNRRTPPRGTRPRGRTGPGRTTRAARQPIPAPETPAAQSATPAGGSPAGSAARGKGSASTGSGSARRRPRFTGRAAILVLVLAVLTVSYASSLRAYLKQRSHLEDLTSQIATREASIDSLESEKRRWKDPAYQEQQARERLGYVMPGETAYTVLDENGDPLESEASLGDPSAVGRTSTPTAWWTDAWESVELAGNPPKETGKPPLTAIDGDKSAGGAGDGAAGESAE